MPPPPADLVAALKPFSVELRRISERRMSPERLYQLADLIDALLAGVPEVAAPGAQGKGRYDALVPLPGAAANDDCGLSIDMLDVDRLREWARLLLVHGADISHWGSVPFVAGKMQMIATGIEKAVRDIGKLRAETRFSPATRDERDQCLSRPTIRPWRTWRLRC